MNRKKIYLIAGVVFSAAISGVAYADFKDDCVEAMKDQGRPGFLVGGVCQCIADKTDGSEELQEEFLEISSLSGSEQDEVISDELATIRDDCKPL